MVDEPRLLNYLNSHLYTMASLAELGQSEARSLADLYRHSIQLDRNPSKTGSILELARSNLSAASQYSIVRWGDGEGTMFAYLCSRYEQDLFENVFRMNLSPFLIDLLTFNANQMWYRWFKRILQQESDEFLEVEWKLLLLTLRRSSLQLFKKAPFSSIKDSPQPLFRGLGYVFMECAGSALSRNYSNQVFFNSPKVMRKTEVVNLLLTANNPLVITSRPEAVSYLSSINRREIDSRIIPGDLSPSFADKSGQTLVDQIYSIRNDLTLTSAEFDLVLFGGGFLGKSIPLFIKNLNAVCVDFGSAFDLFGGVNSRKWSQDSLHSSDWADCVSLSA